MPAQLEVADVIKSFLPKMDKNKMFTQHIKTLSAIERCRTAALGGHIDSCDNCGHLQISYNSCRNRHCPKCQGLNKEMWIIQQENMLLPTTYFHVVYTLPHQLNELCMYNPRFMYGLIFKAAWHTLNTLANDPKWIGAKTAATMVLHTWSQTMILHPHVHCIVPNGGLTEDGEWQFPKRGNGNFLFPVAAMKKIYRGFFMAKLHQAIVKKVLDLPPDFPTGDDYYTWKDRLYKKDWVVYTKKPFSRVHNVVKYLARYSHRVAITNYRIKAITEDTVSFLYKDYKDGAKKKIMTLQGTEFLRRFCLHVLPPYFRKVRHYGFCANAIKAKSIATARKAFGLKFKALLKRKERMELAKERLFGEKTNLCPCCKKGKMQLLIGIVGCRDPPRKDSVMIVKSRFTEQEKIAGFKRLSNI